jgi:hypothetical protein
MAHFLTLVLGLMLATASAARDSAYAHEWTLYRNERFGFRLQYPADILIPDKSSAEGDGQTFVGLRGHGRLLAGALYNREGHTIESYQRFVAKQSWSGYRVTYAPRGLTWFVLSGESETDTFYEKVMFGRRGAVINSFALIYPTSSKRLFDPIVEAIENSFRPGTSGCAPPASAYRSAP